MIRALLSGGDRRSIGRAAEVAAMVADEPGKLRNVIELLRDPDDPVVRMRAADVAEKATRLDPRLLQPYKRELLSLLAESVQCEVRWHLAQMIPRLKLTLAELPEAIGSLLGYLTDRSAIVKTCAMQALTDLVLLYPRSMGDFRVNVTSRIRILARTGTPAMRTRGKKLLQRLA
jgi:hypothetical protein